ncbi:hypothetical protein DSO57_1032127 [Entomophthora muscae]|uniref:Uncharacterized protein n=1 Tax=Entomophthora muscae TaxID=34485 RepID=A0ACC2UL54_9FUNG|nr:hypothetical protein DSO57_1032127 [Entomophthora muscae]
MERSNGQIHKPTKQSGISKPSYIPSSPEKVFNTMSKGQLKGKRNGKPGRPSQQDIMRDWDLSEAFERTLQDVLELADEDDRIITELFVELPSRREYPDYYEAIENPISIKRIKKKVERREYATWADFVQDWVLLSKNAQTYNEPGSQVYIDSQTIQKFIERRTKHVSKIPAIIDAMISEAEEESLTPRVHKKARKDITPSKNKHRPNDDYGNSDSKPEKERVILRIPVSSNEKGSKAKKPRKIHTLTTKANCEDSPVSTISTDMLSEGQVLKHRKKRAVFSAKSFPKDRLALYQLLENQDPDEEALQFLKIQDPNTLTACDLDGATINWSFLHCAAYYGRLEAVQRLIEDGADPELCDGTFGSTALSWAAFGGRYEICKYLVFECKVNRNTLNTFKMSPLDLCPYSDEKKWKFLFTMSSGEDPSQLTSSLRSILRSNGRLLKDLISKLAEYKLDGAEEPLAAPLMHLPSPQEDPNYYEIIKNPLSLSLLLVRSRAYRCLWLLDDHVNRIIANALAYYPMTHPTHKVALELKKVYKELRTELLNSSHGEALQQLNEEPEGSSIPTLYFGGVLFGIGDYVLLKDGDSKQELDILLITEIICEGDQWFASGLGFKHRDQIPEAANFQFQPNEVFKVGNKFMVPFRDLSSKCCVISLKAFSKNSVENFPLESIFLCEFRYLPDASDKFQTIKDWSKTVCSFPFFAINTKERKEALCFVRPHFSDFDPHILASKKNNKKVILVPTQPAPSPPVTQPTVLPSNVAPPPSAVIATPEPPPVAEMPCLDWETQQAQPDCEASALINSIEVEAANLDELSVSLNQKYRFTVDEDFFSLTFGSEVSCAFIVPSKAAQDSEYSVKFRLISNNQELAPVSEQIPKFMFPLQPGLNVARIQASLALPNPTPHQELEATPSQNVTLIFHRLT